MHFAKYAIIRTTRGSVSEQLKKYVKTFIQSVCETEMSRDERHDDFLLFIPCAATCRPTNTISYPHINRLQNNSATFSY